MVVNPPYPPVTDPVEIEFVFIVLNAIVDVVREPVEMKLVLRVFTSTVAPLNWPLEILVVLILFHEADLPVIEPVDILLVLIVLIVAELPNMDPENILFVLMVFDVNKEPIVALLIYIVLKYNVLIGSGIKNCWPLIEDIRSETVLTVPDITVLTSNVLNSKASIFKVPCGVYCDPLIVEINNACVQTVFAVSILLTATVLSVLIIWNELYGTPLIDDM